MDPTILLSLLPIAIKYFPLLYTFLETQGPGVQAFIKEIVATLPKNADGSVNWSAVSIFSLLPVVFTYGPKAISFLQQQGVLFEHLIVDVQDALKGKPLAAPAPIVHTLAPVIRVAAPVGGFNS